MPYVFTIPLVYILPCLFGGFYNVIIFNTNFKAIPESCLNPRKSIGASELQDLFSLVPPLSKPVISALGILQR